MYIITYAVGTSKIRVASTNYGLTITGVTRARTTALTRKHTYANVNRVDSTKLVDELFSCLL